MIFTAALRGDWAGLDRVVFRDPSRPSGGVEEPEAIAQTLADLHGYRIVDSARLQDWLKDKLQRGADGSVLVNVQGSGIPLERLEEYLRAGGRLVWTGQLAGFLNLQARESPPDKLKAPKATEEGVRWGLHPNSRGGNGFVKAADAGLPLAAVDGWASIFFLNLNPEKPKSGLLRYASLFHGAGSAGSEVAELARIAAHGLTGGGAEPAVPLPAADGEGVYVGSGSFKVSRQEALEKLSSYQLGEATTFLLPCARAASASGAASVDLASRVRLFAVETTLSFDGLPLPAGWSADPLSAVFADGEAWEPARHLAFGLLTALRLRPKRIEIVSGAERAVLTGLSAHSCEALSAPSPRTVLRFLFPGLAGGGWISRKAAQALAESCAPARFALTIGGGAAPGLPFSGPDSVRFDENGIRGVISPSNGHSGLRVHVHGAYVCRVDKWTWPAMVEGVVDCAGLRMNISQSGVIRDEGFDAMMNALVGPMEALIARVLERHSPAFRTAAELIAEKRLDGLWEALTPAPPPPFGRGGVPGRAAARLGALLGGVKPGELGALEEAARPLWWLRRCAVTEGSGLMDAPLWLSAAGTPLTRRDLAAVVEELGYLPVARGLFRGHEQAQRILRVFTKNDAALVGQLPWKRRDCDQALNAGRRLKPAGLGPLADGN